MRSPLVDADLCRRLHAGGSAPGIDGLPDLRKAIDLMAGAPFDQLGDGVCEWLQDTRLDREHLALIADIISSKVVTLERARGDTAAAQRAGHVAVMAGAPPSPVG